MKVINGVFVSDYFQTTGRKTNDKGHVVTPGQIARTGVQDYYRYQLGMDGNPLGVVRMYRPEDEVFDAESMGSFENTPITIDHPKEGLVTQDNFNKLSKGAVSDIARKDNFMTATLTIKSQDAIDAMEKGKVQLSNGYTCDFDMTPGTTPDGIAYDGVQRNIRGNHVALVDAARCGSACRVADSLSNEGVKMKKVIIDGIPFELDDAAAAAVDKLSTQLTAANDALTKAKSATPSITYKIGDVSVTHTGEEVVKEMALKDAEIEQLKKDIITPEKRDALVADWALMLDSAKKMVPALDTKGKTCFAIRKEAIAAVVAKDSTAKAQASAILGDKALDAADEATVRTVFNVLATNVKTEDTNTQQSQAVSDALLDKTKTTDGETLLSGREKFIANQQNGFAAK